MMRRPPALVLRRLRTEAYRSALRFALELRDDFQSRDAFAVWTKS
jgi:hypothetical protein